MKRVKILLFSLFCFPLFVMAGEIDVVKALTMRLLPNYAENFIFQLSNEHSSVDFFKLSSHNGKILLQGNNANSMAVGLNYYLKYYCKTTVSWYADIPVSMPVSLPVVTEPIQKEAKVERRFFLNYCTFGYTMPFWKWKDWERLIDWMALNGINMPLAITGQESVWQKVWQKVGLTDEEIRSYFTGPTYLPWHRMANIDAWNGPLPQHWLDTQLALQKKILNRERELNMRPVLPAFAGHVPGALKRIYPQANIQYLGKWAGFSDKYRCHFLNPEEPLFAKIQKLFLDEQTALFGTDHIYGVDPFNEVDPPSWEPDYLKQVSSDMFATLTQADPKAEWMQMTWMFYHDRKEWTSPRVEALLTGVPQGKMMLLDYHCENVELWKQTDKFFGQPYIWCYLGNFGGNTTLTGNVKESGERLDNALRNGGNNLSGIGSTLEGLDVMQFPYEYIFEKAWTSSLSTNEWVNALADRHAGKRLGNVRKAWNILFNEIYVQVPKTLGVLPNLSPVFDKPNKRTIIDYSNKRLFDVWKLLAEASDVHSDALQLDIIAVGRQWMGNMFLEAKEKLDKAYLEGNSEKVNAHIAFMRELLKDIDGLTAYHKFTSIHEWLRQAREYGNTKELSDYYELNARNLITTWGGRLNDYASRSWSGLTSDYYASRWNLYFDAIEYSLASGEPFNQEKLDILIKEFENNWVNSNQVITSVKTAKFSSYVYQLIKKYSKVY